MENYNPVYITVVFKDCKGVRIEVPCESEYEAKQEQEKLKQVGVYSWVEFSSYIPIIIVSQISEQMGE